MVLTLFGRKEGSEGRREGGREGGRGKFPFLLHAETKGKCAGQMVQGGWKTL